MFLRAVSLFRELNVLAALPAGASLLHCIHRTVRGKPYISSVDPRWRMVGLRFIAVRSSVAAYSRMPTSLDRGLIQHPKARKVWF